MYYQNYGRSSLLLKGESWKDRFRDRKSQAVQITPIVAWGNSYGVIDNLGNLHHTISLNNIDIINEKSYLLKPIKIQSELKIVSFSTSSTITAVITDQGSVYLWEIDIRKKLYYPEKLIEFPVKAIKISTVAYSRGPGLLPMTTVGIIGEDNFVYIWHSGESPKFQQLAVKAVDLYIGKDRSALIDLKGNLYLWGTFRNVIDHMGMPFFSAKCIERPTLYPFFTPIKRIIIVPYHWLNTSQVSHTSGQPRIVFLSYDGTPYILDGTPLLKNNKFGFTRTTSYMRNSHPKLIPKPDLPADGAPIRSISASAGIIAMIGENGKLYMYGKSKFNLIPKPMISSLESPPASNFQDSTIAPIEVDIGLPVRYVSVGNNFIVAITDDGVINLWGDLENNTSNLEN